MSELTNRLRGWARQPYMNGTEAAWLTEAADRIEKLEFQVKEYYEQAEQGVFVEHDCPAMFACAFIVADHEGSEHAKEVQP
jgi:hypothetical protein